MTRCVGRCRGLPFPVWAVANSEVKTAGNGDSGGGLKIVPDVKQATRAFRSAGELSQWPRTPSTAASRAPRRRLLLSGHVLSARGSKHASDNGPDGQIAGPRPRGVRLVGRCGKSCVQWLKQWPKGWKCSQIMNQDSCN